MYKSLFLFLTSENKKQIFAITYISYVIDIYELSLLNFNKS